MTQDRTPADDGARPPRDEAATMAAMHRWLEEVADALGVERAALDLAPDLLRLIAHVAHGPSRPGAPLTAFLVGLAAGRAPQEDLADGVTGHIERVEHLLSERRAPEPG